ncbi:MAG: dTDP-4-amino-4,6-dideoxygalactose transaminase, partial [Nitrososphaera sp.]|nr:dTDP-4-amino-4,6-dideoxygalactose transaminase [Nitrososphaera sp.]
ESARMPHPLRIPFNKPYMVGKELEYIAQAHANSILAGDGPFTKRCHAWLEKQFQVRRALLTHSCTAALEMSAILADIQPGDEVVMPSFTFVSTANAFVLRGGMPVFVDVREDTLNVDERLIEAAITPRTKAIVAVHYGGVACEMDAIMELAEAHKLLVIEDAAQGVLSTYKTRPLGSIGHLGCVSFHETKNITSGEGGALLINDPRFIDRAEIIREKGTNRSQFFRGEVNKYTWCDLGSSFLPGELTAAFLWAQMEEAKEITRKRMDIWNFYHQGLASLDPARFIRRPVVPPHCRHNAHMYYILLPSRDQTSSFIESMQQCGIGALFHYVPLHSSPGGKKYGRVSGSLIHTDELANRLCRVPLWIGVDAPEVLRCVKSVTSKTLLRP